MIGITLGVGNYKKDAYYAALRMQQMTGLKCHVYTLEEKGISPVWLKCLIHKQFKADSYLYFDSDIYCLKKWNPLEIFNNGKQTFTACLDRTDTDFVQNVSWMHDIDSSKYLNAGLYMYSPEHFQLFEKVWSHRKEDICLAEQTMLNYYLQKENYEVQVISKIYNKMIKLEEGYNYHDHQETINLHNSYELGFEKDAIPRFYTKLALLEDSPVKPKLPNTTLYAVATINHTDTLQALKHSYNRVDVDKVVYFSNELPPSSLGMNNFTFVKIPKFEHWQDMCIWGLTQFSNYLEHFTEHILQIHPDGYIVNPYAWTDEFFKYDVIGSPWNWLPNNQVGNLGFCFYSKNFFKAVKDLKFDPTLEACHPSDQILLRENDSDFNRSRKQELINKGIKIAPYELASTFAVESESYKGSFGFHKLHTISTMKNFNVNLLPNHEYLVNDKNNEEAAEAVYTWVENNLINNVDV
jgi:hypothetical protein